MNIPSLTIALKYKERSIDENNADGFTKAANRFVFFPIQSEWPMEQVMHLNMGVLKVRQDLFMPFNSFEDVDS